MHAFLEAGMINIVCTPTAAALDVEVGVGVGSSLDARMNDASCIGSSGGKDT